MAVVDEGTSRFGLADAPLRERLLGADPVPWLLASDEPAARWVTLARVLGRPEDDPEVAAAHDAVVADGGVQELIGRLPDWEDPGPLSGHESPAFAPNILGLLADMGTGEQDDGRIAVILDTMLANQDDDGRFCSRAEWKRLGEPAWGALLCDTHSITEVLARYGRADDARVAAAYARMEEDLAETAQGRAWPCRPEPRTAFRGPGRKNDYCPQVTLEALRAFSHLPEERRPAWLADVVGVALRAWRARGAETPYMFGHGRRFKRVKWPTTWYGALAVLDAVGRYPEAWMAPGAPAENTRAVVELAACLVAYNVDGATGTVTPRSCFRGFETFSFGQKKVASPFATARVVEVLGPFGGLVEEIAGVDVTALGSSKGGSGVAVPP